MDNFSLSGRNQESLVLPKNDKYLREILGVRRAVLISTGQYKNKDIESLPAVDFDVDLISKHLVDPHCCFQDTDVSILNSNDCPTRKKIDETLGNVLGLCQPNDFVFIYFSGHGFRSSYTNNDYFVPYDFNFSNMEKSCFSFGALRNKINNSRAKFIWVVVDACRVNYRNDVLAKYVDASMNYTREGIIYRNMLHCMQCRTFDEYAYSSIGELKATKSSLWFQSCSQSEESKVDRYELGGKLVECSQFTWYFCKGTEGEAADNRGIITPMRLMDYVCEKVKEDQTPTYSCQDYSNASVIFADVSDKLR